MTIIFTLRGKIYSDTLVSTKINGNLVHSESMKCVFLPYLEQPIMIHGRPIMGYFMMGDYSTCMLLPWVINYFTAPIDPNLTMSKRIKQYDLTMRRLERIADEGTILPYTVDPLTGELYITTFSYKVPGGIHWNPKWCSANDFAVFGSGEGVMEILTSLGLSSSCSLDPSLDELDVFALATSLTTSCGGRLQVLDPINRMLVSYTPLTRDYYLHLESKLSRELMVAPYYVSSPRIDPRLMKQTPYRYHDLTNTFEVE